ncbi:MAG: glycosyltransferase family 2 protein [Clostridia bacterium]|nr:glycosyltransferase family 2 protein [Clostridia bacterium]
MNPLVTIFTPTYNRAEYLGKLFESLKKQTNRGFKWLIIDDGSADNTEDVVKEFLNGCDFEIKYMKKENGGKHTALNIAFQEIDTKYTFIVDSDDFLTEDAVQTIYEKDKIVTENNLAGISFLCGYDEKTVIGMPFPEGDIFNGIDIQFRYKIKGDKAEVWRTDILKNYSFPVFEGEKFQGENYVWWKIALEYDFLYVNKIIYIAEYLPGGLSKAGKTLRIACPLGGMENSKVAFNKRFPLRERIKRAWLFVCYGLFAKKSVSEIVKESGAGWLIVPNLIFGWLLYLYWNKKYN